MSVEISPTEFEIVYDILSFSLATMMATTIFLWIRLPSCAEKYQGALIISGLVTFIASYHYMRIFNSWVEAYKWNEDGSISPTGAPFNNAYRYMDWVLTVPLLLIEIILVMNLSAKESAAKATNLAIASILMILVGYPGERFSSTSNNRRWFYWSVSMLPFLYIVYTLMFGLTEATASETDRGVADKIRKCQTWTVFSWCTYPVVYLLPMLGIRQSKAMVYVNFGYSVSDIISKCGVGILIYNVTKAKSRALKKRQRESEETAPLKYESFNE